VILVRSTVFMIVQVLSSQGVQQRRARPDIDVEL
jgi:hypothetical protein